MVHTSNIQQPSIIKACEMVYATAVGPVSASESSESSSTKEGMSSTESPDISVHSETPSYHSVPSSSEDTTNQEVKAGDTPISSPGDNLPDNVAGLYDNFASRTYTHTNPILRFNPKDAPRQHTTKTLRSSSVPPAPVTGVHSDMYSTVFALHSLGDRNVTDYLTKVRGIWDGHMQHQRPASSGQINQLGEGNGVTGYQRFYSSG